MDREGQADLESPTNTLDSTTQAPVTNRPGLEVTNRPGLEVTINPGLEVVSDAPLWHNPLFLFWVIAALFLVQLLINGYDCFRLDHTSQIPLIYMQKDPSLFTHDWFLQKYGHFELRKYHLLLLQSFAVPFGLPGGILVLYFLSFAATVGAWMAISRRLHGSLLPALIVCVMASLINGNEIGTNHLLEKILIPRTEVYPFAYWALFFLCGEGVAGALLAGLLLALGGFFQPGVAPIFAAPMLLWLILRPGPRRMLRVGAFILTFAIPLLLRLPGLGKTVHDSHTLTSKELIEIAAYLRHPHHMVPHLWGAMWLEFAGFVALFFLAWRPLRQARVKAWDFGRLAPIMLAILAVCLVFIELIPQKYAVIAQPFRMAVPLYFVIFMILAPRLLAMLREGDWALRLRAIALILATHERWLLAVFALFELGVAAYERRTGRALRGRRGMTVFGVFLGLIVLYSLGLEHFADKIADDLQATLKNGAVLTLSAVAALLLARWGDLARRPRLAHGLLAAVGVIGFALIASFFIFPYGAWIDSPRTRRPDRLAQLCWRYQFNPVPVKGIERVGAWAATHTPKEALFLIPPELQAAGFHIWSKRAAVFCFKYIPLRDDGLAQWFERLLAMHGVLDPHSPQAQKVIDQVRRDYGGQKLDAAYEGLTPEQMLDVARHYGAQYVMTQAVYPEPAFHEIYRDHTTSKAERHRQPYHLYEVREIPPAGAASF